MNRLTLISIILGFVLTIGFTAVKTNKQDKRLVPIEERVDSLRTSTVVAVNVDSILSVYEAKMIAERDSLITVQEARIRKLEERYWYLRQKDKQYEKAFDSLANIIPALPDW